MAIKLQADGLNNKFFTYKRLPLGQDLADQ